MHPTIVTAYNATGYAADALALGRLHPARELARASERLGLLVCGSRALGPLRRVMLGSVSAAVMRSAACPLIVVPRGVPPLTGAAASVATPALTLDADRFELLYER